MSAEIPLTTALTIGTANLSSGMFAKWNEVDVAVFPEKTRGIYGVGVVSSDRALEEVLRLRYEVFNLELGEGLPESFLTGLDRDEFDDQMTHLVLLDMATSRIVGTYRLQTVQHALAAKGLYCSKEFDLTPLTPYFPLAVESGRACIAREHRCFAAVLTLWLGIGEFMNFYGQRYVFGCCSITTRDPDDGWRAMKTIMAKQYLHRDLRLKAQQAYRCGEPERLYDPTLGNAISLPKLFRVYMGLGAKVVSEPAIDRDFGTVDFLVMLDGFQVALSGLDVLKKS